jgi:hypothetical protein
LFSCGSGASVQLGAHLRSSLLFARVEGHGLFVSAVYGWRAPFQRASPMINSLTTGKALILP